MNRLRSFMAAGMLTAVALHAPSDLQAQPSDRPLPPMHFASSIAPTEVFDALAKNPRLAAIDRELWGSPILLLVTHSLNPTAGSAAKGMISAALAGGTLGLFPMVDSNILEVRYEILLHGRPYAHYSFERKLTRAQNMWNTPESALDSLGEDGAEWLLGTTAQFAEQVVADPRMHELTQEIAYYFGDAAASNPDRATTAPQPVPGAEAMPPRDEVEES